MTLVDLLEPLDPPPPSRTLGLKPRRFRRGLDHAVEAEAMVPRRVWPVAASLNAGVTWRFRIRRRRFQGFIDCVGLSLKQPLDCLSQVLQQVPAICDLPSFGCCFCGCLSISRRAVPADDLNTRMVTEPFFHGLCIAVRQEVDDIAPLQVYDDGAVASSFAPRPVVDANEPRRWCRTTAVLLDAPQKRICTGRHGQPKTESRAGLATQGIADRSVSLAEPGGCTSARLSEPWQAFGEDTAWALTLEA